MGGKNQKKVKEYFDSHFVHEIADVEDVTIWATIPGLDESCDENLVTSPERSIQAQYACVAEGRIRYYLVSIFQSIFMTPREGENDKHEWGSRHVSS